MDGKSELEKREALLKRLLAGEIAPESEEGRILLDRDPVLNREFDEIRMLTARLDEAAEKESEVLNSLPDEYPPAPKIDSALRRSWSHEDTRRKSDDGSPISSWFLPLGLVAATLLILVVIVFNSPPTEDSETRQPGYLDSGIVAVTPAEMLDIHVFEWKNYDLNPGETFFLYWIEDGEEHYLYDGPDTRYVPDPVKQAELPDEVEWVVKVMGFNANEVACSDVNRSVRRPKSD